MNRTQKMRRTIHFFHHPSHKSKGDYLKLLLFYHQDNTIDPKSILINLLKIYVEGAKNPTSYDVKLAQKVIIFSKKLDKTPEKFPTLNLLSLTINLLNKNYEKLTDPELLNLFGAFFSIYEKNRFTLKENVRKKLHVVSAFENHLHLRLKELCKDIQKENVHFFSPYYQLNNDTLSSLRILLKFGNLNKEYINKKFIDYFFCFFKNLFKNRDNGYLNKSYISSAICKTLVDLCERLPLSIKQQVAKKAYSLQKSKILILQGIASILIGTYYPWLSEKKQKQSLAILLANINNNFIKKYIIKALLMIPEKIPEPNWGDFIKSILDLPSNIQLSIKPEDYKKALELWHGNPALRHSNSILEHLKQKIKERDALPNLFFQNCQRWLTSHQKVQLIGIIELAFQGDDIKQKKFLLQMASFFGLQSFSDESQIRIYDFLLQCLKSNQEVVEQMAYSVLVQTSRQIPLKEQQPIIDYLLKELETIIPNSPQSFSEIFQQKIEALSLLFPSLEEQDQSLFLNKILVFLDEQEYETYLHYNQHRGACVAIYNIIPMISRAHYNEIVDKAIVNINNNNSPKLSSMILQKLASLLHPEQCAVLAKRLLNLIFTEGNRFFIYALKPYLVFFRYEEKVFFLHQLINNTFSKIQPTDHDRLFSDIYEAYLQDLAVEMLEEVQTENGFYLPSEIIQHIVSFM